MVRRADRSVQGAGVTKPPSPPRRTTWLPPSNGQRTTRRSGRSRSRSPRRTSRTCAHASRRRAGPRRSPSRICRRACRWRRCRRSRATGTTSTTGASARRGSTPCPQFVTEIDGLDIHFVHVRSKHEDALPLVVCHGWPGSFIEQMKIVDLLTDPTAHGGSASDAFHVVIPNMPGYGFSGKPTTTGWDPARIGRAWVTLMKRLGYERFVAAGGDWGGVVVDVMAGGRDAPSAPEPAPPELLGIHTNFPGVVPPEIDQAAQIGSPAAVRSLRRRTTRDRAAGRALPVRHRRSDGVAPADAVRADRLSGRPGGLHARPRPGEPGR